MQTLEDFRKNFEPEFQAFLAARTKEMRDELQDEPLLRYAAHAIALAAGGKRVRPYLCMLAYYGAGGTSEKVAMTLGMGLECFQMFCLVQDDIIDRAALRHNMPALHVYIANDIAARNMMGDASHVGEGHAMLLADLYFSWSQSCIYGVRADVPPHTQQQIVIEYQAMIRRVITGQMLDVDFTTRAVVTQDDVTTKMRLKTSGYSFVSPLSIGFAAAGASSTDTAWAVRFGEALGEGFQLQDDLLDIFRESSGTGKSNLGDIREGQRTFLTQYVEEHGDDAARATLHSMLGSADFIDQHAAMSLFTDTGAAAACTARAQRAFDAAEALVATAPLTPNAVEALRHVIQTLRTRI